MLPDAPATPPLIAWTGCTGTLRDEGQPLDVVCDVAVARDGTVALRFEDLPLSAAAWRLYGAWVDDRGPTLGHYHLALRAENGDTLTTEHAVLTSGGTSSTAGRSVLRLAGEALTLSVAHPPTAEWETAGATRLAKYHLVGLRGFHPHTEETTDGRVVLVGAGDVRDYGELAGELAIESAAGAAGDAAWVEAADERARGILLMVSLGAGRFVRWSVREFAVGGVRRTLEFRGRQRTGRPFDPLFHHLDLGPALRLGVHHYSREFGEHTGLDVAVEWYVMHQAYDESRYLATMTALEHLVAKHGATLGAVLPKAAFGRAREALAAALGADATVDAVAGALRTPGTDPGAARATASAALAELRPKLGNLNRPSLGDSVARLLAFHRVPHDDIVPDVRRLVQVRNGIAHRGLHDGASAAESLRPALAALRELLRRLFLAMLAYEGAYQSHYPHYQTRHFQRAEPAAAPPAATAPGDPTAAPP